MYEIRRHKRLKVSGSASEIQTQLESLKRVDTQL